MSTPTPDEITAALAVLHRVPGVDPGHSLAAVAELASPIVQMAQELHAFMQANGLPLARQVTDIAARYGLRITADPEATALAFGELVGYAHIRPPVTADRSWFLRDGMTWGPTLESLSDARACVSAPSRVVALHLLPEGGKA